MTDHYKIVTIELVIATPLLLLAYGMAPTTAAAYTAAFYFSINGAWYVVGWLADLYVFVRRHAGRADHDGRR